MSAIDLWFYVDQNGVAYNLFDPDNGVYLESISGVAIPSIKNFESVAPLQEGATWRGMRVEPRIISAVFVVVNPNRQALFDARDTWIGRLMPMESVGKLRVIKPDGATFEIDVRYQGGLTAGFGGSGTINPTDMRIGVQWIAYAPIWRKMPQSTFNFTWSLTRRTLTFTLTSTLSGGWQTNQQNITVAGNWKVWPVITITGPIAVPKITSVTFNLVLDFSLGLFLAAGQTAVIDLAPNRKTVKDGAGLVDYSGYLTPASDLTDFRLGSPKEVAGGVNQVKVEGFDLTSSTNVQFAWYDQYLGL